MALVSNVPKIQFTEAGVVLPSESSILSGALLDVDSAFGGGVNPALETPQGQLSSSWAAAIADKNSQFAYFVNQIDPLYASGQFQDAIGKLYFMTRIPAKSTSVIVTITGVAGTVIPTNALAQDTNGETYANSGEVTIGLAGTVTATFNNINTGAIPCHAGTLVKVYQSISGWDAITNPADGSLGYDVESQQDFEFRRKNSVAINARGSVNAIYSNVLAVPNVLDVYVIDNSLSTVESKGSTNYPVAAHSVYVAAVGGLDADIAKAIWLAKDLGCDTNGNTSSVITDDSGYSYPYPSYTIKFERPASLPIKYDVQIVNNPSLPADIITQIKNAIIAKFNGSDGSQRERIGSSIFASNYYAPVANLSSAISILSILIGDVTPTLTQVLVGIDQAPTIIDTDISVTLV